MSPTQFIDASQLLGLKDPDAIVDPGWIMLGSSDNLAFKPYDKPLDISTLINFSIAMGDNGVGTWSLTTASDIVTKLNNAGIFERNYFDHLAFVIKAGDGKKDSKNAQSDAQEGGWAIYDFDFNALLDAGGNFKLSEPYSFTGHWNMDDFGGKAVSHMSLWARDPISANVIPVPGTLLLLGIGLIALGGVRNTRVACK